MSPSEYLSHLQARQFDPSIRDFRAPLDPERKRAADEALEKQMEEIEKIWPGQRKELENFALRFGGVGPDAHLKFINTLAIELIKDPRRELLSKTAVGELRLHEFNASAIKVPGGGYVIAVNVGLFGLLNHIASLLITQPIVVDEEGKKIFDADISFQAAFEYIFCAIGRYVSDMQRFLGPFPAGPGFVGRPEKMGFCGQLTTYAELFVLAHEYGHIALGHLDQRTKKMGLPGKVAVPQKNHAQEVDADLWAVELVMLRGLKEGVKTAETTEARTINRRDLTVPFCGADLFLTIADLIEKLARWRKGARDSPSHPPASLRRRLLRQWLSDRERNPFIRALKKTASNVDESLLKLLSAETMRLASCFESVADSLWTKFDGLDLVGQCNVISGIKQDGGIL